MYIYIYTYMYIYIDMYVICIYIYTWGPRFPKSCVVVIFQKPKKLCFTIAKCVFQRC